MATINQSVDRVKSVKHIIKGNTSGVSLQLNKEGFTSSVTNDPKLVDQSINNGGVTSDTLSRTLWGSITGNILSQSDLMSILDAYKCKIISLTTLEYTKLERKDFGAIYIVLNSEGAIYRVYIGNVLIFSENVLDNQGFPYTFPIIL